jgi:hypothetical protein
MYGQNEKLSGMEKYLEEQGFDYSHVQKNVHGTVCHVWHCYMNAGATRTVVEYRGGHGKDITTNTPDTDSINAAETKSLLTALDSIRHTFNALSPFSSESYMYEYHKQGADSVKYSLAFAREDTDSMGTWRDDNLAYFPNAREMAHLNYFHVYDKYLEGYYHNCNYDHWLMVGDSIPEAQWQSFDAKGFDLLVQSFFKPILKQKGVKAYPIYWRHDTNSFVEGDLMMYEQSDEIDYGLTTGTHYFIPAKYKEMAVELLERLRAMTLDYVNSHPEQLYAYYYDLGMDKMFPWTLWKILYGYSYPRWNSVPGYQLRGSQDDDGLHIVSMITDGELWIPHDWKTLKSYINGEKKYRK